MTHLNQIALKIGILFLPLLVSLAACTTAEPVYQPGGHMDYLVACGAGAPWSVCDHRAAKLCPKGYTVIFQSPGWERKQMGIKCAR